MVINKQQWEILSSLEKAIIFWYLRYLNLHSVVRPPKRYRPVLRLAGLHLVITLFTLSLMPPPPELTIIAVPIAWGASFSTILLVWRL